MMLVRIFFYVSLVLFILSSNSFAMHFSPPVEIGWMGMSQKGGGFSCKNETSNSGDYYTVYDKNNKHSYGKGIAKFGAGKDALYIFYDVYQNKGLVQIGVHNSNNTTTLRILNDWIYMIKSDEWLTLYPIRFLYGPESDWRIVGSQKNGKFVKYISTLDITEKYFGFDIHSGVSPVLYDIPICKGDTIIIKYRGHLSKDNIGEFRFKWDEAAQWFGVEQVVY